MKGKVVSGSNTGQGHLPRPDQIDLPLLHLRWHVWLALMVIRHRSCSRFVSVWQWITLASLCTNNLDMSHNSISRLYEVRLLYHEIENQQLFSNQHFWNWSHYMFSSNKYHRTIIGKRPCVLRPNEKIWILGWIPISHAVQAKATQGCYFLK